MLRENFNHGFPQSDWDAAKAQARLIMVERARKERTIAYSDLVGLIDRIELEAHDPRLFHFLGEIASEEDEAGRGMLTALVVHKHGDMQPGPGFFELASALGRDTSVPLDCWIEELRSVFAVWSKS